MKKIVTALALTAIVAGSVSAREFTPFSGTPAPEPESGSDVCLEYDGGAAFFGGFGSYYGWSQNTVVHFEAPAGTWTLSEAQYYLYGGGAGSRTADVYTNPTGLSNEPTVPAMPTAMMPTISDTRAPTMMRLSVSRPKSSAPMG